MTTATTYVYLLDEGVDVWRPVLAKHIEGSIYQIVEQPYDREIETWKFVPGDLVVVETIALEGEPVLAAMREVSM